MSYNARKQELINMLVANQVTFGEPRGPWRAKYAVCVSYVNNLYKLKTLLGDTYEELHARDRVVSAWIDEGEAPKNTVGCFVQQDRFDQVTELPLVVFVID